MKHAIILLLLAISPALWADDGPKPVTLFWDDLLPGNADIVKQTLAQSDQKISRPPQDGNAAASRNKFLVVEELDGYRVRLPGFIVPLEYTADGKLSEFLLVPYQGACIHEPAPDANQIVYTKAETRQEFPNMWTPVWVVGTLRTQHYLNDVGSAAYTMQLESWEEYRGR